MADDRTPRTILMTGATHGLGRALVDRFTEYGHTVAGCGSSVDTVQSLRLVHGSPHHFATVDVADSGEVEAWARECVGDVGPPHLLVNNAAIMNQRAPLWTISAEDFDRLLAVNISGVANVIRSFLPSMLAAGRGTVVNISSGWGRMTAPEVAPYCASKFAIEGLTRALAQELPPGLTAVAVSPGIVDTRMLRRCWREAAVAAPTPEDWSHSAAPFLLSLGPEHNGQSLETP